MKITDEQKQLLQACTAATADMTAALAAAGTLCMYEAANALDAGVALLISSASAGELVAAYAKLATDLPEGDMYTVAYTDPVNVVLPPTQVEFTAVMQVVAKRLLLLRLVVRDLHCSSVRARALEAVLEQNRDHPQDAEYQDAQLYRVLHRQAIWRNLALCIQLQRELLLGAVRINMLWRNYKRQLPEESIISGQNVADIFASTWQERASEITAYQLPAFDVDGYTAALEIIKKRGQLTDPALLLDGAWHTHLDLLSRSFQQTLDDFSTQEA